MRFVPRKKIIKSIENMWQGLLNVLAGKNISKEGEVLIEGIEIRRSRRKRRQKREKMMLMMIS
jgi:ABC-type uncharacterized transport system ATPase component